jgi:hypothetical protein
LKCLEALFVVWGSFEFIRWSLLVVGIVGLFSGCVLLVGSVKVIRVTVCSSGNCSSYQIQWLYYWEIFVLSVALM